MRNVILFLAIIPCLFFCAVEKADAQTDTTLHLELSPDSMLFITHLKTQKKVQQAMDTFWIDGQSITIVCENSANIIEKIICTVRASAVEHSVIVEPAKEGATQPEITQPRTEEKYDPDIDKFLNIEDESVFSDEKFRTISKQQIHPRSYKYYCLISDIYELGKKIKKAQQLGLQQIDQAKKLVDEMSSLIEQIMGDDFKSERQMLSQKQKDYYNQLYKKYEELWYFLNK